jgi:hypothetical protein
MSPSEKSALKQYYVRDRGKIYGPFDRSFIQAMILGEVYSSDLEINDDGGLDWVSYKEIHTLGYSLGCKREMRRRRENPDSTIRISPAVDPSDPPPEPPSLPPPNQVKSAAQKWLSITPYVIAVGFVSAMLWILNSVTSSNQRESEVAADFKSNAEAVPSEQISRPESPPERVAKGYTAPPVRSSPVTPVIKEDIKIYTGANGQMQAELASALSLLNAKETQLDVLGRKLERDRLTMDNTSQLEVDQFNQDVQSYNTRSKALQSEFDGYNKKVESFNAELERVGTRY